MNLHDALVWLFNSGGGAIVASFILELIPAYQALESNAKKWIYFGITVLITVAGYLAITYIPAEIIAQASPIFALIYASFVSVFVGTAFHKVTKKPTPDAPVLDDGSKG
jgi:hypothetical protein